MTAAVSEPFARAVAASAARHYAWIFASPQQRSALATALALERELLDCVRPGIDHGVAHARLEWWRDEADRTVTRAPMHPLTRALTTTVLGGADPPIDLRAFVTTLEWDFAGAPCATDEELQYYTRAWSTVCFEPIATMFSPETPRDWSTRAGAKLREIEILGWIRDDPALLSRRAAGATLAAAGLSRESLERAPASQAVLHWLTQRRRSLESELAAPLAALPPAAQQQLRPLLVWCYAAVLTTREAIAAPAHKQPGGVQSNWRTFRLWRSAVRANRGKFSLPAD